MRVYKSHIAVKIADLTGVEKPDIESLIEAPPLEEMGDLAFPCFAIAKVMKKSPKAIAEELQEKMAADEMIDRIEARGPYVNFFLNREHLISTVVAKISESGDDYAKSNTGSGKTVVIEYSSPNIAKPFGIGHLRSTVIGSALKRIYRHLGYNVVSINHLGDWGTQFGKLVYAFKKWGDDSKLRDNPIEHLYEIYVKVHKEEEDNPELSHLTRTEFRKLEDGNPENISLWKRFSDLSRKEFEKIYRMLGVKFDDDSGESFYLDKIITVEDSLKKANLLTESQEAVIVDLEEYGMPPMLIRKSDETTLYATRDLAAAIYRRSKYKFEKMIYVVGVAQSLYFRQLFKVLELMGNKWAADCHHVSFGWVKLGDEMMSTRRGNIVFLEDVIAKTIEKTKKIIEESGMDIPDRDKIAFDVGIGAVIFADLAYRRESDISFDWDKMLDFKGHSGPYLQYTHARICSVIRKYRRRPPSDFNANLLRLPEEHTMAKMLSIYPDIICKAAKEFEPNFVASFLLELCGVFNTYYQKYRSPEDRILSSNPDIAQSRVAQINCVRIVLRSGLNLLGIAAPEIM